MLYNVVRKGSSAYFAGEFGGLKMRLNLGFEFFGCFVLRKLWRQLYSDAGGAVTPLTQVLLTLNCS